MFPGISFWMMYFDDASITRLIHDLGKSFRDRDSPGWSMSTCYVIRFADFLGEDDFFFFGSPTAVKCVPFRRPRDTGLSPR